jgi:hypothetical protein
MDRSIEGGDTWVELVFTPPPQIPQSSQPQMSQTGSAVESPVPAFEKRVRIHADGRLEARYTWDATAYPADAYFGPELSITRPAGAELAVAYEPAPTAVWEYPIETVSKSEQGLDRTVQGVALTPLWPASLGRALITLTPAPDAPTEP